MNIAPELSLISAIIIGWIPVARFAGFLTFCVTFPRVALAPARSPGATFCRRSAADCSKSAEGVAFLSLDKLPKKLLLKTIAFVAEVAA